MKLDLRVPTSLNDIPLYQYQQFIKAFENEDNLTEQYAGTKMLEIFCGLKLDEALKVKITDLKKITTKLTLGESSMVCFLVVMVIIYFGKHR